MFPPCPKLPSLLNPQATLPPWQLAKPAQQLTSTSNPWIQRIHMSCLYLTRPSRRVSGFGNPSTSRLLSSHHTLSTPCLLSPSLPSSEAGLGSLLSSPCTLSPGCLTGSRDVKGHVRAGDFRTCIFRPANKSNGHIRDMATPPCPKWALSFSPRNVFLLPAPLSTQWRPHPLLLIPEIYKPFSVLHHSLHFLPTLPNHSTAPVSSISEIYLQSKHSLYLHFHNHSDLKQKTCLTRLIAMPFSLMFLWTALLNMAGTQKYQTHLMFIIGSLHFYL